MSPPTTQGHMPTNQKDVSAKSGERENKGAPDKKRRRRDCVGGGASTAVLCLVQRD